MLNLPDALEVYGICRECISDDEIASDTFVSPMLSRIDPDKCFRLLELLSKKSMGVIEKLDRLDMLAILINGFNQNEIRSLYAFCKEVL